MQHGLVYNHRVVIPQDDPRGGSWLPIALSWAAPWLLGGCFIGLDRAELSPPGDVTQDEDGDFDLEAQDDRSPDEDDGEPGADGVDGEDGPDETESPPPAPPEPAWAVTCGTGFNEEVSDIAAAGDGTFVAVGFRYEHTDGDFQIIVVKIAPRGEILWTKSYGGNDPERAYDIAATRDGGFVVAASSHSYGNEDDGWLILRLDATGDVEWQADLDRPDEDMALAVIETPGGSFAAAGYTIMPLSGGIRGVVAALDATGVFLWKKSYGFGAENKLHDIVSAPGGGFVAAGYVAESSESTKDFLVLKLDGTGAIVTHRVFDGGMDEEAVSVSAAVGGGYVVAGTTSSPMTADSDLWVARLSESLEVLWQKFYTGPGSDASPCVRPHPEGGFVLTAESDSAETANGRDLVILKLDDEGNVQWRTTFGGEGRDADATCPAFAPDGGIVFAGETESFGEGGIDILVLKIGGPEGLEEPCPLAVDAGLSGEAVSFEPVILTGAVFDSALEERTPSASPDAITLQSGSQCD
jgi:hypothetical protein